jgi:arylsulfatase A-like enzyme
MTLSIRDAATPSAAAVARPKEIPKRAPATLVSLLATAAWFGLVCGFGEGIGLLLFQRINWAEWARVIHVSKEILWISPLVDLWFFLFIGLTIAVVSRISPRIPAVRLLAFLLIWLTAYDWLMLTRHFYRSAALLFGLGLAVAFGRWLAHHEAGAVKTWTKFAPPLLISLGLVMVAIEGGKWIYQAWLVSNLPAAKPGTPNVLIIVVDTLRADHLSAYGYPRSTSPHLDELGRNGVVFENAIAPSSWSLPSHASLITGRAVDEHGMGNVEPMPWRGWGESSLNGLPTLGEAFKQQGYRTGAFSANRIYFTSNVGLGRGFIHFEDYFDSVGDCFVRTGFGREFARLYMNRSQKSMFTRAFRHIGLGSWLDKDSEGSGDYGGIFGIRKRADEVNRETLRWVARDRRHPFLVFLNYLDVHFAYGGPPGYSKPAWDHGTIIDEYDAGIKYTDDFIGRLLRGLDDQGVLKNTIVIVTSDHGESLGDHGLSFHGAALYRELVHVPLIISYPGHIPARTRVEQPVENAAIATTVMNLVGAKQNPFPGPPLTWCWTGARPQSWPDAVSELPETNTIVAADRVMQGKIPIATDGGMKSVISPRFQLIVHEKYKPQIYDWTNDPGELNDLADRPTGRSAITALGREISH